MTLIAINRTKRGVQLVTDTKMIDPKTDRTFFVSKTLTFPHLRAAVVFRGHSLFAMMVYAEILDSDIVLRTFDDLLANAEVFLKHAFEKLQAYVPEGYDQVRDGLAMHRNTVVFAGWSTASNEAKVQVFQRTFTDESFTVVEVEYDWHFPGPPVSMNHTLRTMFERKKPVAEILLFSAKAVRDMDEVHRRTIGGHLVLTTIGPDRLEQRVIHTWPEDLNVGPPGEPHA